VTVSDPCTSSEVFGFGVSGQGGDIRLLESSMTGTTELTAVGENVGQTTGSLTDWFACKPNYAAAVRLEQVSVPGHDSGKATARCKKHEAVIFGGFASSAKGEPAQKSWITSARPFDSKDSGKTPEDGWTVTAQNSRNGKVTLSAQAVCAPLK
jgi:hypothetical protein